MYGKIESDHKWDDPGRLEDYKDVVKHAFWWLCEDRFRLKGTKDMYRYRDKESNFYN